jgi:hypothetical protein
LITLPELDAADLAFTDLLETRTVSPGLTIEPSVASLLRNGVVGSAVELVPGCGAPEFPEHIATREKRRPIATAIPHPAFGDVDGELFASCSPERWLENVL